jgi:mRNA-degrading endonuclease YafQ of YafQ-DinJ toxin-antitoxin module
MAVDADVHYDFSGLVRSSRDTLLLTLAETHSSLANLHIKIAFLRAEEDRDATQRHHKAQRHDMEGLRDAYIEKKWLIVKLLEERPD